MKTRILFLNALLCVGCKVYSQSTPFVVSSGGGTNSAQNISLEWTLGEPSVESSTTSLRLLTQGFHQPLIIVPGKLNQEINSPMLVTASVYPNPVQSILNVKLSHVVTKASVTLINMQGNVVFSDQVNTKNRSIQIDMETFPPSVYFLNVRDEAGKVVYTSKVIKALLS